MNLRLIAQILGGMNMLLAIVTDSIPHAIFGAVIYLHAVFKMEDKTEP